MIAVAGTLGGTLGGLLLGNVLDARREKNRLRRETALLPLPDKMTALREAYYALAELVVIFIKASADSAAQNSKLQESLDRFEIATVRTAIWMMKSPDNMRRMIEAQLAIREVCGKVLSLHPLSDQEFVDNFSSSVGTFGNAIGLELGIPELGRELQEIGFGLGVKR